MPKIVWQENAPLLVICSDTLVLLADDMHTEQGSEAADLEEGLTATQREHAS